MSQKQSDLVESNESSRFVADRESFTDDLTGDKKLIVASAFSAGYLECAFRLMQEGNINVPVYSRILGEVQSKQEEGETQ